MDRHALSYSILICDEWPEIGFKSCCYIQLQSYMRPQYNSYKQCRPVFWSHQGPKAWFIIGVFWICLETWMDPEYLIDEPTIRKVVKDPTN